MEPRFWHDRWAKGEIGFHEGAPNASLVSHFHRLGLKPGGRVFVPLCGKTRDLSWLAAQGQRVCGAELSRVAADDFFAEAGTAPVHSTHGPFTHLSARGIEIFVGDIFELSDKMLGPVDAVYDRAALVAMPLEMRPRYAAHLAALTNAAPQLVVALEFGPADKGGPPFSVTASDVSRYYSSTFVIEELERTPPNPARRDGRVASTVVWLLRH